MIEFCGKHGGSHLGHVRAAKPADHDFAGLAISSSLRGWESVARHVFLVFLVFLVFPHEALYAPRVSIFGLADEQPAGAGV